MAVQFISFQGQDRREPNLCEGVFMGLKNGFQGCVKGVKRLIWDTTRLLCSILNKMYEDFQVIIKGCLRGFQACFRIKLVSNFQPFFLVPGSCGLGVHHSKSNMTCTLNQFSLSKILSDPIGRMSNIAKQRKSAHASGNYLIFCWLNQSFTK